MTERELIDKITHWMLIYFDINKCLPKKKIFAEVEIEVTHLMIMLNDNTVSKAAKAMKELRTTVSQRLSIKGQMSEKELRELCEKHSVDFVPRRKMRRPQSMFSTGE